MTALTSRTPAEREAYFALLTRLAVDLTTLRLTSSNPVPIAGALRLVQVHVDAELLALARAWDRVRRQRDRLA